MDFRQEMHDRVYAAFRKQYDTSNTAEKERLDQEMEHFDALGWHEDFLLIQVMAAKCRAQEICYSTSLDGSFAAYLLNIAQYSPLGSDLGGFDLQMNWNPKRSFWIRTAPETTENMRKTLWRFADGDVGYGITMPGMSYILHPGENGGQVIHILGTFVYSLLDKMRLKLGPADPPNHASLWEGGLYKGYVPGFFNEADQYSVRKSGATNWSELTNVMQRVREIPKTRALYLAADYLSAISYIKQAPAEWFAAYLSSEFRLFDYERMGKGKYKCRQERLRNLDQMLSTDRRIKNRAENLDDVFRACEGAYACGIGFLPPDPIKSDGKEFLVLSDKVLLSPLPYRR